MTMQTIFPITGKIIRFNNQTLFLCDQLPLCGAGQTEQEAWESFFLCAKVYYAPVSQEPSPSSRDPPELPA